MSCSLTKPGTVPLPSKKLLEQANLTKMGGGVWQPAMAAKGSKERGESIGLKNRCSVQYPCCAAWGPTASRGHRLPLCLHLCVPCAEDMGVSGLMDAAILSLPVSKGVTLWGFTAGLTLLCASVSPPKMEDGNLAAEALALVRGSRVLIP